MTASGLALLAGTRTVSHRAKVRAVLTLADEALLADRGGSYGRHGAIVDALGALDVKAPDRYSPQAYGASSITPGPLERYVTDVLNVWDAIRDLERNGTATLEHRYDHEELARVRDLDALLERDLDSERTRLDQLIDLSAPPGA